MSTVITNIEISDTQCIRVAKTFWQGHEFVDIRKRFRRKGETEWQYTQKGIMIPDNQASSVTLAMMKVAPVHTPSEVF